MLVGRLWRGGSRFECIGVKTGSRKGGGIVKEGSPPPRAATYAVSRLAITRIAVALMLIVPVAPALSEPTARGEDAVRCAAVEAEKLCLVSPALDVPVHVAVTIETAPEPAGDREEALIEL